MTVLDVLKKLSWLGERQLAQQTTKLGIVGLFEERYGIDEPSPEEADLVYFNYQNLPLLLPQSEDYIAIRDAHAKVGLSKSTLRRWCVTKKVKARKDKDGKWEMLKKSLHQHIIDENYSSRLTRPVIL